MSDEKKAGPPERVWIGPDPIVRGPKCVWYADPLVHAAHRYILASVAEARIAKLEAQAARDREAAIAECARLEKELSAALEKVKALETERADMAGLLVANGERHQREIDKLETALAALRARYGWYLRDDGSTEDIGRKIKALEAERVKWLEWVQTYARIADPTRPADQSIRAAAIEEVAFAALEKVKELERERDKWSAEHSREWNRAESAIAALRAPLTPGQVASGIKMLMRCNGEGREYGAAVRDIVDAVRGVKGEKGSSL